MGGKERRLKPHVDTAPLDVFKEQKAKEVVSAEMRRTAREQGVARTPTVWGELWMEARTHGTKYNWRYRVVLLDRVTREEIFVVRESTHPTMVDIAVSMLLRLSAAQEQAWQTGQTDQTEQTDGGEKEADDES